MKNAQDMRYAPNKGKGKGLAFLCGLLDYTGDDCVLWPLWCYPNGYGAVAFTGIKYAHRVMCELAHGPSPEGHEAAHSCGVRGCVNPNHLSWKTASANQLDRRIHGTADRPHHLRPKRLAPKQREEIIALKGRLTQREIAARYGVSFQNVSHIHRKSLLIKRGDAK